MGRMNKLRSLISTSYVLLALLVLANLACARVNPLSTGGTANSASSAGTVTPPPSAGSCSPTNLNGCEQTSTLNISGSAWNGKILQNCKIYNTGNSLSGGEGILIENVQNLTIKNCEIYNSGRAGIRLGISQSTQDVTLIGNTIHHIAGDGISAGQRHLAGVDHLNLKILNNTLYETGLQGTGGLHHGMYIQASDFLIEGNSIENAHDGNGISVRSSGIIRNNLIKGAGEGAITYYSDHLRGPTNLLVIENNIAYGNTAYATIQLLGISDANLAVQNFKIRFNTAVSMIAGRAALAIASGYGTYNVDVYGSILINTMGTSPLSGAPNYNVGNTLSSSLAGFVKTTPPYDFHLLSTHSAKGFANGVKDFPAVDFDRQIRMGVSLDSGALQFQP